ncbi:MAG: hypothetical protein DCF29_09510 [Alphaproteobacteria bacterium]|nr:MAG: hypothetical protein DCF29_09510 [Alphaproteobacteria bacterium]
MNPVYLTIAAVAISLANFVVMLASFWRLGQWKDSDDARRLIDRVTACESGLSGMGAVGPSMAALGVRVGMVETDITGVKARMENVATKADVARLAAEVAAVEGHASRIESGVERIESYLINGKIA